MTIRRNGLAIALLVPGLLTAQQGPSLPMPASRAEFVRFFESSDPGARAGAFEASVAILRGEAQHPGLATEMVARDLVELAVSSKVYQARTHAVTALRLSGQRDKATPYPRAVDRLVEIHDRATDIGIRAIARGAIVNLSNPQRALQFLKPIAENANPRFPTEQHAAINLIAQLNTQSSAAFLRDLDRRGVVTHPRALEALKRYAAAGYRAPREAPVPPAG